jgi:hypothetical protein
MAYEDVPKGHTEFGGGPGMVDPERRKDRAVTPEEELRELYALDNMRDDESVSEVEIPRRPGTRRGEFG